MYSTLPCQSVLVGVWFFLGNSLIKVSFYAWLFAAYLGVGCCFLLIFFIYYFELYVNLVISMFQFMANQKFLILRILRKNSKHTQSTYMCLLMADPNVPDISNNPEIRGVLATLWAWLLLVPNCNFVVLNCNFYLTMGKIIKHIMFYPINYI